MKRLAILCCALLAFGPAQLVFGQAYPNKPIRVVVPFPAGESIEAIARQGAEPVASSPEEFAKFLRIEYEKWGRAVKSSGARVD